jgi:hypothetical protein
MVAAAKAIGAAHALHAGNFTLLLDARPARAVW